MNPVGVRLHQPLKFTGDGLPKIQRTRDEGGLLCPRSPISRSTEELADWAAMLLLNDAYDWEGPDEDEIADLLNDLSTLTLKPKSGPEV